MAKPRPRKAVKRKERNRTIKERVLIVCEGKTEQNYFQDLNRCYQHVRIKVEVAGPDPSALVQKAKKLKCKVEHQREKKYDKVFCVFDRDDHAHFDEASENACRWGMQPVRTWPCFEYWFLLHFDCIRPLFASCKECIARLKKDYWSEYDKGQTGHCTELWDKLEKAVCNARQVAEAVKPGEENPSTEVHNLVKILQSLNSDT